MLKLAGKQIWQQEASIADVGQSAVVEIVAIQDEEVVRAWTKVKGRKNLVPRVNRLRNSHPLKLHCPLGGHSTGNRWAIHNSPAVNSLENSKIGFSVPPIVSLPKKVDAPPLTPKHQCFGPLCEQIRGKVQRVGCAPPQTVLVSYIGAGLLPGDTADLRLVAGPMSTVEVTSAGATLVFGKARNDKRVSVWGKDGTIRELDNQKPSTVSENKQAYSVHPGALLVVAQQPMIPCKNANLLQQTTINLMYRKRLEEGCIPEHSGGSVVLIEWMSSGRKARGESWNFDKVELDTRIFVTHGDQENEPIDNEQKAKGSQFLPAKNYDALTKEEFKSHYRKTKKDGSAEETNCIYMDCQRIIGDTTSDPATIAGTGHHFSPNFELPPGVGHSGIGVTGTIILLGPRVEKLIDYVESEVRKINQGLQTAARGYSIRDTESMKVKGCDASGSAFIAELDLPEFIISTSRFETNLTWKGKKQAGMTVKLLASSVEEGMERIHVLLGPLFQSLGSRILSKSSQLTASQGNNWTSTIYGQTSPRN